MRALRKSRLIISILLSFLVLQIAYALDDKADKKEKTKYTEWLEKNKKAPGYAEKLLSLVEAEGDVGKSIGYVEKYSPFVENREKKALIEKKVADLYLLTGDIPKARDMYEKSWKSNPSAENVESLLLSSIMFAQMGEMEKAKEGIEKIKVFDGIENAKYRADFLYGLILFAQGQTDKAIDTFQALLQSLKKNNEINLLPKVMFSLYSAYRVKNDFKKMNEYYSLLSEKYNKSIEYRIISNPDSYMMLPQPISIITFMKKSEEKEYYIQTGSFRVRENAEYMMKDLLRINFDVTVEESMSNGAEYYRVLVGPFGNISSAHSMLKKLKANGFIVRKK